MTIQRQLYNHPINVLVKDVKQICKPLFEHLGVSGFGYSRVKPDGSRAFIDSDHHVVTDTFLADLFLRGNMPRRLWVDFLPFDKITACFESDTIKLMATLSCDDQAKRIKMKQHYLNRYGVVDRLLIVKKSPSLAEGFIFRFDKDNHNKSKILHNYSLYIRFTRFFQFKAKSLIYQIMDKPVIPGFRNIDIFPEIDSSKSLFDRNTEHFLDQTSLPRLYVPDNNHKYLTKKELEYAQYIVKGLSAREIGDLCYVSKRTIETHIHNIKNKLDVFNKSALIEKLIELEI